jgi:hypothetical protein
MPEVGLASSYFRTPPLQTPLFFSPSACSRSRHAGHSTPDHSRSSAQTLGPLLPQLRSLQNERVHQRLLIYSHLEREGVVWTFRRAVLLPHKDLSQKKITKICHKEIYWFRRRLCPSWKSRWTSKKMLPQPPENRRGEGGHPQKCCRRIYDPLSCDQKYRLLKRPHISGCSVKATYQRQANV